MRRFFIDENQKLVEDASAVLTDDEFHHLKNVCRLEEGERVELLDGKGRIAAATITEIAKKTATLKIHEVTQAAAPAKPRIEIVLCVPRFQTADVIVQKCVELGVAKLSPVVSERSFVKTLSEDLAGKATRWNKISAEACKQSGRAWPMEIAASEKLSSRLDRAEKNSSLFLYEGEAAIDIKSALEKWKNPPDTLTVFVGAEGGFSPAEVARFVEAGLSPVTMGPLVLRVETACIALVSVIEYHFGCMR